jgi:hypothetical protein
MISTDEARDEEYKRVDSEERLLADEDGYEGRESTLGHERRSSRRFRPVYLHVTLILVYSAVYIALILQTFSLRSSEAGSPVYKGRPTRPRERPQYPFP